MTLSPIARTRLDKAAVDNGFDRELPVDGPWLAYASTQCPLRVWIGPADGTRLCAVLRFRLIQFASTHPAT